MWPAVTVFKQRVAKVYHLDRFDHIGGPKTIRPPFSSSTRKA